MDRHASRVPHVLLAAGVYAVAAAVFTFPLVLHLSDTLVADTGDPLLNSWILAWDAHALSTSPLHLFDANIFYPFPLPLTYSETLLTGALLVAPIQWLTGNPVLAHNALTLASLLVSGLGGYALVRALTGDPIAAGASGYLFAFAPAWQAQMDHVQLLQIGWLPLALVCLHRLVRRGRATDAVLFAGLCVCQSLASFYLMYLAVVAIATWLAFELITHWSGFGRGQVLGLASAGLIVAACMLPVALPYASTQRTFAFAWPTDLLRALSATPLDYVSVSGRGVLDALLLGQPQQPRFANEHALFPGLSVLVLAVAAVFSLLPRTSAAAGNQRPASPPTPRREIIRYAAIGGVALALSFGPVQSPFGPQPALALPAPYRLLAQWLPGFDAMRVPARFDFLVTLSLAVLAGFGVHWLRRGERGRPASRVRRMVLVAAGVLALAELASRPLRLAPIAVGDGVPPVYAWLKAHEPAAAIAELPAVGLTGLASYQYAYFSTYHWHPLVDGVSGFEPAAYAEVAAQMDRFPDPAAVENLRSLGVRYVIAHLDALDTSHTQRLAAADLAALHLSIAATLGRDVVYALAPIADPTPLQDLIHLDLPSTLARGLTPFVTATVTNTTSHPLVLGVPRPLAVQLQWEQARPIRSALQGVPVFVPPDDEIILPAAAALNASTSTSADAAELRVQLTGSVQLEATATVRLLDLPTSRDPSGLAGSLERVELPAVVRARTQVPIQVTARNTGRDVWLAGTAGSVDNLGVVGVGIKGWLAADGSLLPAVGNSSGHVGWNVNPGQAASIAFETSTPAVSGRYTLVLGLLSEQVAWFDAIQPGALTSVAVDVEP